MVAGPYHTIPYGSNLVLYHTLLLRYFICYKSSCHNIKESHLCLRSSSISRKNTVALASLVEYYRVDITSAWYCTDMMCIFFFLKHCIVDIGASLCYSQLPCVCVRMKVSVELMQCWHSCWTVDSIFHATQLAENVIVQRVPNGPLLRWNTYACTVRWVSDCLRFQQQQQQPAGKQKSNPQHASPARAGSGRMYCTVRRSWVDLWSNERSWVLSGVSWMK